MLSGNQNGDTDPEPGRQGTKLESVTCSLDQFFFFSSRMFMWVRAREAMTRMRRSPGWTGSASGGAVSAPDHRAGSPPTPPRDPCSVGEAGTLRGAQLAPRAAARTAASVPPSVSRSARPVARQIVCNEETEKVRSLS